MKKKSRKVISIRKLLPFIAAPLLLGGALYVKTARSTTHTVVQVIDGDTVEIENGKHIRLIGIDTPEKNECYDKEATQELQKQILNKQINIETDVNEIDQYERILAYIFTHDKNKTFINSYLLKKGTGRYFEDSLNNKYKKQLIKDAEDAHSNMKGMWHACAPDERGCIIKGNLDRDDKRYYHLPDSLSYDQVSINLDKRDRWFCTEEEAIKAGFVKATR